MQKWAAPLRGRQQWTEEQAREVLARRGASGLSVERFARQMGFVPQRLHWWRSRLAKSDVEPAAVAERIDRPQFVPVVVRAAEPAAEGAVPLRVHIGGRVVVDVLHADASTAAWVAWLAIASAGGAES
jgi:transposase-like protein